MRVLGIDPGPERSGWCVWDGERVVRCGGSEDNFELAAIVACGADIDLLAVEIPSLRGAVVYEQVIRAAYWAGRFVQAADPVIRVVEMSPREHMVHNAGRMVKNNALKQCLVERFGHKTVETTVAAFHKATGAPLKPRRVLSPGPLYGVSEHAWDALSVAVTAYDRRDTL